MLSTGNLVILAMLTAFRIGGGPGPSYRCFILGKLLQALAWPLLGLRGSIPDLYSAYIGNTILISGFALETFSLTAVNLHERKWKTVYTVITVSGLTSFWVIAHTPNIWVAIASLTTLALYLTASVTLISTSRGSRIRFILGLLCGLLCLALGFRSGFGFFSHAEFVLMSKNIIQTASFMALFFLMLVGGIGYLLMLKELDDRLLSESEEKYRTLVEKADEAIVIVQDGKLVFANTRMYELINYPGGELEGRSVFDFIHPDERGKIISNYENRMKGEALSVSYDFRIISLAGEDVWVSVNSTRIQWKGRPAVLSLMTDITKRKKMEEEREGMISDLRKTLAEVKTLSGLLPICSSCKKIRDDSGYWSQIEEYIKAHSEAEFSHSLCPDCVKRLYPDVYQKIYQPDKSSR
jgi:PAS domain S-box-containing protein